MLIGGALLLILIAWTSDRHGAADLRLNHIQVIGSHNSYKIAIDPSLMDYLKSVNPDAIELDYAHRPISEQLALGVRGLELDVLYDPLGGQYTRPQGISLLAAQGVATSPYDTTELAQPGFKVFHVPDIDFRSHCLTFAGCLSTIRAWSQSHPRHLPIIITINPKNQGLGLPGFTEVVKFDAVALQRLDEEILAVFSEDDLITPSLVKGDYPSLPEAIAEQGWPRLADARGKLLFAFDANDSLTRQYLAIEEFNRPMFPNVASDHPLGAFLIMNNPIEQEEDIRKLVQQGFMVRTRSDANTKEARTGDTTRFQAAMRSGAQLISTDYYLESLSPNQDFIISFSGQGYSRCNPVLVSEGNCNIE